MLPDMAYMDPMGLEPPTKLKKSVLRQDEALLEVESTPSGNVKRDAADGHDEAAGHDR